MSDKNRTLVYRFVSDMMDNPDSVGIYPTTKCYDALEKLLDDKDAELAAAQSDLLLADKAVNAGEALINNLQAKLARYEQAGREMPEEPDTRFMSAEKSDVAMTEYAGKLRAQALALKVRADMWQARCLSLFWRGEADDVICGKLQEAANKIEAALKEQKT